MGIDIADAHSVGESPSVTTTCSLIFYFFGTVLLIAMMVALIAYDRRSADNTAKASKPLGRRKHPSESESESEESEEFAYFASPREASKLCPGEDAAASEKLSEQPSEKTKPGKSEVVETLHARMEGRMVL